MRLPSTIRRCLSLIWASPYSLIGLLVGGAGLCCGGRARLDQGVLEFHSPLIEWMLDRLPLQNVLAITLGHTVIARNHEALEVTREHERVHVRQFERWGLLMGPAYLGCSLVLWIKGRDAYWDNPFEREAYENSRPQA